jgi:hypothetical protein
MSPPNPRKDLPLREVLPGDRTLHPAWGEFIRFCADLRYGDIERLSIQDGLPVLAEMTKKKVKFMSGP